MRWEVSVPGVRVPDPRRRRLRRDMPCRVTIKTNGTDCAIHWRFLIKMRGLLAAAGWHEVCLSQRYAKPTRGRKLLIASVGVATINYVAACGGETQNFGQLGCAASGRQRAQRPGR